jgi:hypothetical protein
MKMIITRLVSFARDQYKLLNGITFPFTSCTGRSATFSKVDFDGRDELTSRSPWNSWVAGSVLNAQLSFATPAAAFPCAAGDAAIDEDDALEGAHSIPVNFAAGIVEYAGPATVKFRVVTEWLRRMLICFDSLGESGDVCSWLGKFVPTGDRRAFKSLSAPGYTLGTSLSKWGTSWRTTMMHAQTD